MVSSVSRQALYTLFASNCSFSNTRVVSNGLHLDLYPDFVTSCCSTDVGCGASLPNKPMVIRSMLPSVERPLNSMYSLEVIVASAVDFVASAAFAISDVIGSDEEVMRVPIRVEDAIDAKKSRRVFELAG